MSHPYPSKPIQVIHLKGTDREIGRQHAEAVGDAANSGMAKFYYDFWKRLMKTNAPGRFEQAVFKGVKYLVDPYMTKRLMKQVPAYLIERVEGLAEGLNRDFDELATSLILPDLLPMLQAYLTRVRPALFLEASPPMKFACSSFVANGKNFLHGRNLDFPGVAYWDRYPVIQSTAKKGWLRYIGFTTAGAPLAGITGVNEAQISVSLHQHYCKETTMKGSLPFATAEEILGRAKSLRNAIDILRDSVPATAWAFIVTDGKTREAVIYECHPNACGVRFLNENDGLLTHSNYFQTHECQSREYATTARMNWDNYYRKTRLDDLLRQAGDGLDARKAVTFLSDHFDRYWNEEKIFNRTVSQVYNIQSLVLDSENMKVWMAEGDTPVHLRQYRGFDLGKIFSGERGDTGEMFPAYQFQDPKKRDAKEAYILSFVDAFDGRFEDALKGTRKSLEIEFTAEAALVSGVMLLKLEDFHAARDFFQRGKEFLEKKTKEREKQFPPEYFELCLQLARAYDLLGEREKALVEYDRVARHKDLEDNNLRAIARREGPYDRKRLKRIVMPYSSYIPFE